MGSGGAQLIGTQDAALPLAALFSRMAPAHSKHRHTRVRLCKRHAAMHGLLAQPGHATTTEFGRCSWCQATESRAHSAVTLVATSDESLQRGIAEEY